MRSSRRRARAVLLAALLAALFGAACGGGGSATVGSGPSTTAPPGGGQPAAVPGSAPTAASEPGSGQAADDGTAPGSGGGGATGGDPLEAGPDGPPPDSGFPTLDASGPPGSFAPAVLRPASSNRLVLELLSAPDAGPSAAVVEHMRATLGAATGKPVTVTSGAAPSGSAWSSRSVRDAADAGAATAQGGGTAVLRLLFLHGSFDGQDGVLGVAVRGDVAAVFVDRAADAAGLLGDPEAIITSVATHELGHLLGLVDLVLDTGRDDPEHPGHSTNTGSVMYWAVESDLVASLLGSRPPRDFDADDLADLRTIAGA